MELTESIRANPAHGVPPASDGDGRGSTGPRGRGRPDVDADPPPRRSGMVVFSDDWGRHPSSCQHLVRRLLGRHEVLWVNTIGTRPPRLDRETLARGLEKVRGWTRPRGDDRAGVAGGPSVVDPRMWPWFRHGFDRRLNRALLLRQLGPRVAALPRPRVAVTSIPLVADLVGALEVDRWVYYCADDIGEWPGVDRGPLRRMERLLLERVDAIVAVSEALREKLRGPGRDVELLTHGVDLDFWSAAGPDHRPPPELEGLERPLVVFWGLVDRRLDLRVLERLSGDLAAGTILLVGPESDPDPRLATLGRVARRPAWPFERLPALALASSVLIMPYADLPVTRAMQPLKLKEYLAAGRPAVVVDLPANREWSDCLDVVGTPESFSEAVRLRLATGLPAAQRAARARLSGEGWLPKSRQFERWALQGLEDAR